MSDFTIDTQLPVDAADEAVRQAHLAALAEAAAVTVECPTCGDELLDNGSARAEHAKETGHAAF